MKSFLILLLSLSCSFSYSQNDDETVYYLTRTMSLEEYDFNTNSPTVPTKTIIAQKGWRFTVDQPNDDGYIIKFLKWPDDNNLKNQTIYATVTTAQVIDKKGKSKNINKETVNYYQISNSDYNEYAKKFLQPNPSLSFVTGAITVPIKIRPGGDKVDSEGNKLRPFDFNGDINIGLSFGFRIRLDKKGKVFLIPAAGINLTSISIDENTVKNGIITSKTNASSLTPFIGFIGEYDNFQVALMTGWDRLSGKTGENWIYQGKPWFGIGLGYNIFNTSNNNPSTNSKEL
ncbi:hypothetical protein [Winogradskyella sp.]|uniref:hypothetical protein n=1 Tax=Winogradskyella sp. TaxID=1883156 RepID=UPI0025CEAF87|nr:hypothetical protein [Winogradskyella sp.]